MSKVMTIRAGEKGDTVIDIHVLNPGEFFKNFGGSRHSLEVKHTASIITSTKTPYDRRDVEYGLDSKEFWEWMTRIIHAKDHNITVAASTE